MARALARIVVTGAAAAGVACAAVTGLGDYSVLPDVADVVAPNADATTPVVEAGPALDAADASAPDARLACPDEAPATAASGPVHATRVASDTAIAIDGDGTDWPCVPRVLLDATTAAAFINDKPLARAELSVAWSEHRLFFRVHVDAGGPLATGQVDEIFRNDAVELYLGIDNPHTGGYEATDIQMIVDYVNRAKLYRDGVEAVNGIAMSGVTTAAVANGNEFVVELSVPTAGPRPLFAAGQTFGFDLQIDEHGHPDAGDLKSACWLFQNPNPYGALGTCKPPRDVPSCDQAVWGALVLDP